MYTSMTIIALTSLLTFQGAEGPNWQTDYFAARQQAIKAGKPLAVVFGSGEEGYDKVSQPGLNGATRKMLANDYVCCYVDVSTKAGRDLAATFEITKGVGIVLSDRSGKVQAFHHDGSLAVAELRRGLERFADPNVVVNTTVTDLNQSTSFYSPSSVANSGFNAATSSGFGQMSYPGAYGGGYGGGAFGGMSGSCPSCGGGGGRRR
jgi:hypothetical protein